tara:strand:+ start:120 stop:380 length:261 start_codon:yes stop_codon:yes gene_type:complete
LKLPVEVEAHLVVLMVHQVEHLEEAVEAAELSVPLEQEVLEMLVGIVPLRVLMVNGIQVRHQVEAEALLLEILLVNQEEQVILILY